MTFSKTISQHVCQWLKSTVAGVVLSVSLTACGGQTVNMEQAAMNAVALSDATLPADIKLVSSAVLMKMKGFPDGFVQGVTFAPEASPNLKAIGMDYNGFVIRGVNIVNYDTTETGTELVGVMVFEDDVGRRAGVRLLAHYQIGDKTISIDHASIVPVYTTRPRIEAYIVPFDPAVDQGAISADHTALYVYAVNHAVAVEALPAGLADYDVFLFQMDRASPTALTAGRISATESPRTGYEDATTVLDFNGWRAAVVSGEINPKANKDLYVKLLHTPGKEAAWYSRTARLRGLFGMTLKTIQ